MQCKFKEENLVNRRWRTSIINWIAPAFLKESWLNLLWRKINTNRLGDGRFRPFWRMSYAYFIHVDRPHWRASRALGHWQVSSTTITPSSQLSSRTPLRPNRRSDRRVTVRTRLWHSSIWHSNLIIHTSRCVGRGDGWNNHVHGWRERTFISSVSALNKAQECFLVPLIRMNDKLRTTFRSYFTLTEWERMFSSLWIQFWIESFVQVHNIIQLSMEDGWGWE